MKKPFVTIETAPDLDHRRLIVGFLAVGAAAAARSARAAGPTTIEVWTGPGCGCCHDWVAHLRADGFIVETHDGGNTEARARLGVPVRYGSCHTAEVEGYAVEGHVPAREVRRLLDERPAAIGLSVPAMPRGAPGMDGPAYGGVSDPYDVLLIGSDGSTSVYQSYR
jgi:hypothetical protein